MGEMSQRGWYMPGWQFWGAHNDKESLMQREANDHLEEATNATTSSLASLCQSIPALPEGPCHLARLTHPSLSEQGCIGGATALPTPTPTPSSAAQPRQCHTPRDSEGWLGTAPWHHCMPSPAPRPCSHITPTQSRAFRTPVSEFEEFSYFGIIPQGPGANAACPRGPAATHWEEKPGLAAGDAAGDDPRAANCLNPGQYCWGGC